MNNLEYIWLSNLEISNEYKFELIKKFQDIKKLYKSSLDDLVYFDVKDNIIRKILDKSKKEKALRDFEYMEKNKINIISFEDKEYPDKFKMLKNKPISFYFNGNKNILNKEAIGIVGSRVALRESLNISRLVANGFSNMGVNVISGLAKGVDKYAHLGALDRNRKRENNWSFSIRIK